jgi:Flp pilus assembly secretin CpaC
VISFSANEYVEIEPKIIKQNQPYAFMMADSKKVGSTSIKALGSGLESSLSINSQTTDPTTIHLSYPKTILPDTNNIITIQALDSVPKKILKLV